MRPPTAFSGYHRRAGFFAARGRQIVPGEVRDCSLPDVPALALHLLGEGIPRRYTQNVPRRLFPPEHFLKRPMEYVGRPQDGLRKPGAATLRPDPAVEEQLRGLRQQTVRRRPPLRQASLRQELAHLLRRGRPRDRALRERGEEAGKLVDEGVAEPPKLLGRQLERALAV